jgi:hypothetical protein
MSTTRWQYQVTDVKTRVNWLGKPIDSPQEVLSRLGAQGWELVAIHPVYGHLRMYFKRPG